MLRVVRAPTGSQGGDPPKVCKVRQPSLTDGEVMRLAAALRHLKAVYGSWACLSEVMGVTADGLRAIARGAQRPGARVARRAAIAVGRPFDALLGKIVSVDSCSHCGASRGAST